MDRKPKSMTSRTSSRARQRSWKSSNAASTISFRRATAVDVDAITALVREAYAPWVGVIGGEPRPMLADYAVAVERHIIDLHHRDGALTALIEMREAPDHLLVLNVAVAPAAQGRGLGRALLAHAERFAGARGLGDIRLYTNKLMTANLRLYLALGYGVDGEERFMDGAVIHMSKRVRARPISRQAER